MATLQEKLIYTERRMIACYYCNHKFKHWWYKRKYNRLKKKIQKEALHG